MKIKIPAKGLARMLAVVGRAAAKTATTPVLSGILFEAKKGTPSVLRVSATDMEISATVTVAAQGATSVEEGGAVVIPAGVLSQVVRSLPDGDLVLAADAGSGQVVLTHRNNEYKMAHYAAADYPRPREFPGEGTFTVPARALAETAEKVLPAASSDHTKPVITGVLVSFLKDKVHMVATDSYRMSIKETALSTEAPDAGGGPEEEKRALIPARAMAEAARLVANLAGGEGVVRVALTENAALFSVAGVVLSTRLIEGQYVKWEKILPKEFAYEFSVDAREMLDSVKRANLFATRQTPAAPLRLDFSSADGGSLTEPDGSLTVSTETKETGGATERLGAAFSGPEDEFAIAFAGTFLAAGLEACGSERVRIRCNEPASPAVMLPAAGDPAGDGQGDAPKDGEDHDGYLYMLMPMREPSKDGKPAGKKREEKKQAEGAAEDAAAEDRRPEKAPA